MPQTLTDPGTDYASEASAVPAPVVASAPDSAPKALPVTDYASSDFHYQEPYQPSPAAPTVPDQAPQQPEHQYSNRLFNAELGTDYVSGHNPPSAEQQLSTVTESPETLTHGSEVVPGFNLGSTDQPTPPLSYIDNHIDRVLSDHASGEAMQRRIDSSLDNPDAPASLDQIQRIVGSNKNPLTLAAQGAISDHTAVQALDAIHSDWDQTNPWQAIGKGFQAGGVFTSAALGALRKTIGEEEAGLLTGRPGPIASGVAQLAASGAELLTGHGAEPVGQTPSGALKTWEQVNVPMGQHTTYTSGDQSIDRQQAEAEAHHQQALRTVLGSVEGALTATQKMGQMTAQHALDAADTVNRWLGLHSAPGDTGVFQSPFLGVMHGDWAGLDDAAKLSYVQQRVAEIRKEGQDLAGNSDEINAVTDFLAHGASGSHALSPLEQKAFGAEVSPEATNVGSLIAQGLFMHGLGSLPGADSLINKMAGLTITAPRIATWTPGMAMKFLSSAAANQKVMGTVGAIAGTVSAIKNVAAGHLGFFSLAQPYYAARGAAALASKGWLSKLVDIAALPVNAADRVLATAASEAAGGKPFFEGSLAHFNPDNWMPEWLKPPTMEGSVAKAGPITRALAVPIASGVKAGITAGLIAPEVTETPQEAGEMTGTMAGLGAALGTAKGAVLGAQAPFDHIFVPKYDPLVSLKPEIPHAPYFDYGTDKNLDSVSKSVISILPKPIADGVNDLKDIGRNKWEVYAVDNGSFNNLLDAHMASMGENANASLLPGDKTSVNARGFFLRDGLDGKGPMQAIIRGDSITQALSHEGFGHPVWDLMKRLYPEKAADFLDAAKRTTNMDVFANDYVRRLTNGGTTDASYHNLPPGMDPAKVDDELAAEHGAGLLDGTSVDSWTKNPSIKRKLVLGVGSVLEHILGIPITSMYARHEFSGFNPSVKAGLMMDQAARALSRNPNTVRPWTAEEAHAAVKPPAQKAAAPETVAPEKALATEAAPGAAPPSEVPAAPPLDEGLVDKLLKTKQYNRDQAIEIVRQLQRQGGPQENAPRPGQETPFDIAKSKLTKYDGWSAQDIESFVPKDTKTANEAIQAAYKAKAASNAPISEASEDATASKDVAGTVATPAPPAPPAQAPLPQTPATVAPPVTAPPPAAPTGPGVYNPNVASPIAPPVLPQATEQGGAPKAQEAPKANEPVRETSPESAPLQKRLRKEGVAAGRAQRIIRGGPQETVTQRVPRGTSRPVTTMNDRGSIGHYGYVGDATPDTDSLMGRGAFKHSAKDGSLINGYSAALTDAGARMRGVRPGQEFEVHGKVYRYDDRVPSSYKGRKIPDEYVDVYNPGHPADNGVSAEEIARQQAIADQRPGNAGDRGDLAGETGQEPKSEEQQPPSSTASSAKAATPLAPGKPGGLFPSIETPKAEERPAKAPLSHQDISDIVASHEASTDNHDAALLEAAKEIGKQHAASLPAGDERVRMTDNGLIAGTHFVQDDPYHQWLLRNVDPKETGLLQQLQEAIKNRSDLHVDYGSAPEKGPGSKEAPTAAERGESQAEHAAQDRAKGEADIQQAGKTIIPSYVGVALGKKGAPNSLIWGGVSPDKVAMNSERLTDLLGRYAPYKGGPLKDNVAEEDFRGWLDNLNNGWHGDGSAPLRPAEGSKIPEAAPDFVPYHLSPDPVKARTKSDFWNLALAGKGTKLGVAKREPTGELTSSGKAQALAEANQRVVTPGGQVNQLAIEIEKEAPGWIKENLHSGYEMLRGDLTKAIHPAEELLPEKIHVGHPVVAKAIKEAGYPLSALVKAGFMPGKEIVSPNIKEGTNFEDAKKGFFTPAHHQAKQYARDLEDAFSKSFGYKKGEIHDAYGDWGDGAENSIVAHTEDTPFQAIKLKTAMKVLNSAQKQGIAWEEHPGGDHALYELNFNKTPQEVRDTMQAHALAYKTILADAHHGEPTTAYVLDTDGNATTGVASLTAAPRSETGLARDPELFHGHGEFIGDTEGASREVAARSSRDIISQGIGENGAFASRKGVEHLRDLAAQADQNYDQLKAQSGRLAWMPGDEEDQKIIASAKRIHGVTNDIDKAGFMLPDGSLLNMQDSSEAYRGGKGGWVHGLVRYEGGPELGEPGSVERNLRRFIKAGAVRIDSDPYQGVVEGRLPLTHAQISRIRDLIKANQGTIALDIESPPHAGFDFNKVYDEETPNIKALGEFSRFVSKQNKLASENPGNAAFMPGDVAEGPQHPERIPLGMTRLYRVNPGPANKPLPDWIKQAQVASGHKEAQARWFTSDPGLLDWYKEDAGPNHTISHIDVPASDLDRYRVSNTTEKIAGRSVASFSRDPENEFFLPRPLADKAEPISLKSSGPSQAAFMPGDVVEGPNGERERIRAAAAKFPDGKIYEAPLHAMAYEKGLNDGQIDKKSDIDQGYVVDSGKFISTDDIPSGDKAAREFRQRRVIPFERSIASIDTPKSSGPSPGMSPEGSQSKVAWMPGDLVENARGEVERIREAAVRVGGHTFTGPFHGAAYSEAEEAGVIRPGDWWKEQEGYVTNTGRFITRDQGWDLAKARGQLAKDAKPMEEQARAFNEAYPEEAQNVDATGLDSYDLSRDRHGNIAYLPGAKAPKDIRDSLESPERKAFIASMQQKAQDWLDENVAHPLSTSAVKVPPGKHTVEGLADILEKQNKPLDLSKESVRQKMAAGVTHDVMNEIAKDGSGVSWYDVTPDTAIKYVNDHLDNSILENPENTFAYKVAQAITSQGQDVYNNAETGWNAYRYFKDNGEFPTKKSDVIGGGTGVNSILANFDRVNRLAKQYGVDGLQKILETKMPVRDWAKHGLSINGEAADYEAPGALVLGPKIGAFYSALAKNFDQLVMDLWFSRSMGRMKGDMFKFSPSALKGQINKVKSQIESGDISLPQEQESKITDQINSLLDTPTLTRKAVLKSAPDLVDWAHETHKEYVRSSSPAKEGPQTYYDKTPVNLNAKALDEGLHKTQDAPQGPKQRAVFRDVMKRSMLQMHEAGIPMTIADGQAALWYAEQKLFRRAGAYKKPEGSDYLDAAIQLVKQYKDDWNNVPIKSTKPSRAKKPSPSLELAQAL